jgi:hypothetical protein
MKKIVLGAAVASLLTRCVTSRDPRTQPELDRDAEIWTRAYRLQVATAPDTVSGCRSLGVVSEHYFEGPPRDPLNRPMGRIWVESVLRFKTAQLGGDTALLSPTIRKWSGELNESRLLGEAYLCGQPALTTASQ